MARTKKKQPRAKIIPEDNAAADATLAKTVVANEDNDVEDLIRDFIRNFRRLTINKDIEKLKQYAEMLE